MCPGVWMNFRVVRGVCGGGGVSSVNSRSSREKSSVATLSMLSRFRGVGRGD